MRGGRIYDVRTLEDTAQLQQALVAASAAGNREAHAAPITDESVTAPDRRPLDRPDGAAATCSKPVAVTVRP